TVPHAHQERPEPRARALPLGEAADHHLLALETLDLEPGHAATGRVERAAPLGHRALEPKPAGAPEEGAAPARHVGGVAHGSVAGVRGLEPGLQRGLAALEGLPAEIAPVQMEEVEDHV